MTTELTDDDIRERLDLAEIDLAAAYTSGRLLDGKTALVNLAPGDATCYRLAVVPPLDYWEAGTERNAQREFLVVLTNDFGRPYPWSGQDVHPSYAAARWTIDGARWTGVVLAAFLNAVAGYLGDR